LREAIFWSKNAPYSATEDHSRFLIKCQNVIAFPFKYTFGTHDQLFLSPKLDFATWVNFI